jgi:hypothetical protein
MLNLKKVLIHKWFDKNPKNSLRCLYLQSPVKKDLLFMIRTSFSTITIDLSDNIEYLFKNFSSTLRNEIKQSIRFNFKTNFSQPDSNDIIFFNNYFSFKKIPKFNNRYLRFDSSCIVSSIYLGDTRLASHLYIKDLNNNRIRLVYSAQNTNLKNIELNSYTKKAISLANKYLHYNDILYFKNLNFHLYDLGGININDYNINGIASFKKSFSNKLELSYNYTPILVYLIKYFYGIFN